MRAVGIADRRFAAGLLILGSSAVLALVLKDPRAGYLPSCMFRELSGGHLCPGCGTGRMIHALGHGSISDAFQLNPLAFVLLPFFAWWALDLASTALLGRRLPRRRTPRSVLIGMPIVIGLWWILRNLDPGPAAMP